MWGLLWLAGSWLLPHGDAPWTALIPGALLVAFCAEALRVLTVYYVARKVGSSSAIYGGLGAAAALLTWFYLVARAMVGSLVLNATLWGRRQRGIPNGFRRVAPGNGQESTVQSSTLAAPWLPFVSARPRRPPPRPGPDNHPVWMISAACEAGQPWHATDLARMAIVARRSL